MISGVTLEKHDNTAIVFADISGSTKLYVDVGGPSPKSIAPSSAPEIRASGGPSASHT